MVTDMKFKVEELGQEIKSPIRSFGTIDCGYETMTEAWPTLDHVFSSGGLFTKAKHELEKGRLKGTLLNKYPVDLILIDRGQFHTPSSAHQVPLSTKWEILVENAMEKNGP
jgi:hypothetical protein